MMVDSDFFFPFLLTPNSSRYSYIEEIFFNVHFSVLYGLIHLDKPEEIQRRQFLQLVSETSNRVKSNVVLVGDPTL